MLRVKLNFALCFKSILKICACHRIRESQTGGGWKWPLEIKSNPLLEVHPEQVE